MNERNAPTVRRSTARAVGRTLAVATLLAACASGAGESGGREAGTGDPANRSILLDPTHPEWSRPSPPLWRARFETSEGDFVIEAVRARAPNGSDRLYNLIRLGYQRDLRFHRVNAGYIVQWGLHGDPAVNAAWRDHPFPDDPKHGSNVRGTLAFARAPEPGTSNVQVYVNLADNTRNDGDPFAVFGRVVEGMEVLDHLYAGYGERSGSGVRQGRQGEIVEGGNAYLDREWPLLDRLQRAVIAEERGGGTMPR